MSAYVVGRAHIQFLVSAALNRRILGCCNDFSYFHAEVWHKINPLDDEGATRAGQMLWEENIRAVLYRYPDCTRETCPGPNEEDFRYSHQSPMWSRPVDPVAVLKACDGYEYQACEDPEWDKSEARAFIDTLRAMAIRELPGYETAEWEVKEVDQVG